MGTRWKRLFLWPLGLLTAAVVLLSTLSCSNLGYYARCTSGHLSLITSRQPINDLICQPDLAPELRANLEKVVRIRDFASRELHLPENGSYRSYVDLKRPYVVWNVVAAPEFDLQPVQWCFPVAGCVNYRGFFSQEEGEAFARDLRQKGFDVYFYGVTAYSTLGWFDDPVLNTFFNRREEDLAGLIFHELAHQQVYVKNDSAFNESFAKTVEMEGVARWLAANGEEERIQSYLESDRRHDQFIGLVRGFQQKLQAVYAQPLEPQAKREAKEDLFRQLREGYGALKAEWGGYAGYDRWFAELNNAKLASVSTYYSHVPAFQALLRRNQGDLGRFYAEVAALGRLPKVERVARLKGLRGEQVAEAPDGGANFDQQAGREKL